MPLVIQFHDGLSCPTIVCDWCQQPITDARDGGYFFPTCARDEGVTVPITFLHKGACDDAYGARHGALWEIAQEGKEDKTREAGNQLNGLVKRLVRAREEAEE